MAPPTIVGNVGSSSGQSRADAQKRRSSLSSVASGGVGGSGGQRKQETGLLCRVKYCNTLPDIPFDPKFLAYPFDANRFVKYSTTSLERQYKHELLTELDLGIDIDLVNPDTYRAPPEAQRPALDPVDEALISEETGTGIQVPKRSRHDQARVSWLRKTEYISNEANKQNQIFSDKIESRINLKNKVFSEAEDIYKTKEKQIEAIEKTFEDTKRPVEEHYSKKGVYAVEVMPLLPDFHLWQHPCAQVIFDSDPTPKDQSTLSDDITQAMIRGMVDDSGDQFVAYFLPTKETRGKRKRDEEEGVAYHSDEEYEYELSREYNWNVKNKSMKGYDENYFFVLRDGVVNYNELETRVRLSKRRKIGQPGGAPTSKTKLLVKHRDFNQVELDARTARMANLQPLEEEEEEEEEDDDDEEEEEGSSGQGDKDEVDDDDAADDDDDDDSEKDKKSPEATVKSATADNEEAEEMLEEEGDSDSSSDI